MPYKDKAKKKEKDREYARARYQKRKHDKEFRDSLQTWKEANKGTEAYKEMRRVESQKYRDNNPEKTRLISRRSKFNRKYGAENLETFLLTKAIERKVIHGSKKESSKEKESNVNEGHGSDPAPVNYEDAKRRFMADFKRLRI